jgi:uncharacterized membrane protein YhaH (DUF805 family)
MTLPEATPPSLAEPMTPAQILFSLRGRIPRKTWWLWGVLALLVAAVGCTLLLGIAGVSAETAGLLVNLAVLWPAIATSVKRWHDRDKSGWWVLVNLIPVVGLIWVIVENGCLRGTVGPNRFGEDLTGRL